MVTTQPAATPPTAPAPPRTPAPSGPSSYFSRLVHFTAAIDPRNLVLTQRSLRHHQEVVRAFEEAPRLSVGVVPAEVQRSRRLLAATLHPGTREAIPLPFRMSAFVPMNVPIALGMVLAPPVWYHSVFWQWLNQSYNAGFNYCNSASSGSGSGHPWLGPYTLATAVSVGIALLGNRLTASSSGTDPWRRITRRAIPYLAVVGAGLANVVAIRAAEVRDGIPVRDARDGQELGRSRVAARQALLQCALTRVLLPVPVLLFPPYVLDWAFRRFPSLLASSSGGRAGRGGGGRWKAATVQVAVLTAALAVGLPAAVALFPQEATLPALAVEPHLRRRRRPPQRQGEGPAAEEEEAVVEFVTFNKGI